MMKRFIIKYTNDVRKTMDEEMTYDEQFSIDELGQSGNKVIAAHENASNVRISVLFSCLNQLICKAN